MFLLFLVSVFGFLIAHRIFQEICVEFAMKRPSWHIFFIANLLFTAVITLIFRSSPVTLWIFIGILLITLKFFPVLLRFFWLRRLRSALIPLLDGVILGVQAGKSFRVALQISIEAQQGWIRLQFQELLSLLISSDDHVSLKSALLKDFLAELREIDQSQSRCLEQVKALRRHLKIQEDFRRRSGQLTQQIKMQAIIVTFLYLSLIIFVIAQFGIMSHLKLIVSSVILFSVGLIWVLNAGRRMKWKV